MRVSFFFFCCYQTNMIDTHTPLLAFLLLRAFAFLLLGFNKNKSHQSFTAHHQFVINIHLVSSVLSVYEVRAYVVRSSSRCVCRFLCGFIFVKVNFRVHIYKLKSALYARSVDWHGSGWCCCWVDACFLFSSRHLKMNLWTLMMDACEMRKWPNAFIFFSNRDIKKMCWEWKASHKNNEQPKSFPFPFHSTWSTCDANSDR